MAFPSMSRPDDFEDPAAPHAPLRAVRNTPALSEIARKLAAHDAGASTAQLALDLVLNEIAEQACVLTQSSGAAVFLARGDQIVCRASAGPTAPDLGMRLNKSSGLSGDCFQSRQWQCCEDAYTDPRVDGEVCRNLNIRSVLVYPVLRLRTPQHEETLGVIELFSPLANAFDESDLRAVQHLAHLVVENVDLATEAETTPAEKAEEQDGEADFLASFRESDSEPRWGGYWTLMLTAGVIVLAVTVGWMIGRASWHRAREIHQAAPSAMASEQKPAPTAAEAPAPQAPDPPIVQEPTHKVAAQKEGRSERPKADPDGLVVYKEGKIVFRSSPADAEKVVAAGASASPPVEISPNIADGYLTRRIEPDYPEQARTEQIQGPVVMDVMVNSSGVVKELKLVSGDPILAAAASDAVRQWRFKTFFRNGQPSEFQTRITVDFRLP